MLSRRTLFAAAAVAAGSLLLPEEALARTRRGRRTTHGRRSAGWASEWQLSLKEENELIDREGYARYRTSDEMRRAILVGDLLPIDFGSPYYGLDPVAFAALDPYNEHLYAHVAPPVIEFLESFVAPFAREHDVFFQICSLTRPVEYQLALAKGDHRAAKATRDDNQSGHSTGHVIDFALGDLGQQSGPARTLFRNEVVAPLVRMGHARARMERHGCGHVLLLDSLIPAVAAARAAVARQEP